MRAASRLNVWLRENVGDTADWPVRLQCSDIATADALACLLSELGSEVQAILKHGADAQIDNQPSAPERSAASAPAYSITGQVIEVGDLDRPEGHAACIGLVIRTSPSLPNRPFRFYGKKVTVTTNP